MRRAWDVPADVRTVHLGAFAPERAPMICDAIDRAGIVWWAKGPGAGITRLWDREVHLFVDSTRLDEARAIVASL